MRVGIVGGGVAGAMLALRLNRAGGIGLELFTGAKPPRGDASGASGGLVRGFESDPGECRLAAESLIEVRADRELRVRSAFQEAESVYVPPVGTDIAEAITTLEDVLPGSAEVVDGNGLARTRPFRDLPEGAVGVVERRAGFISPDRLRASLLAELSGLGVVIRPAGVARVTPEPVVRTEDGVTRRFDAVVVAAGAWTPRLLARSGLPDAGLRTKQIQYSLCRVDLPGLGTFVDETSGLYGRPYGAGEFLLGLPVDRWNVDPDRVAPDPAVARRVVETTERVFGVRAGLLRTVASFDCYHPSGGLRLRGVQESEAAGGIHRGALRTFTGGGGGAAKTVLAASRAAAAALLGQDSRA